MREIRPSGLEGGVRSIPHPYPYQNYSPALKQWRRSSEVLSFLRLLRLFAAKPGSTLLRSLLLGNHS